MKAGKSIVESIVKDQEGKLDPQALEKLKFKLAKWKLRDGTPILDATNKDLQKEAKAIEAKPAALAVKDALILQRMGQLGMSGDDWQ